MRKKLYSLLLIILSFFILTNVYAVKSVDDTKYSNEHKGDKIIEKRIFIGDSRTVGMQGAVKANSADIWSAKVGEGLDWMIKTGVPNIEGKITDSSAVIILMGVNDYVAADINTTSTNYANYINGKAAAWVSKGAVVYYVSVNPVDDSKSQYAKNASIVQFNSLMKSKLSSNVKYIDTNTNLSFTTDSSGIHYNKSTYKKIYNYILKKIYNVSGTSSSSKTGSNKKVKKVIISGKNSVKVKKSITLSVDVSPSGASKSVKWSSSDKSIATVNKSGKVTGKKKGTVTITATSRDGSKTKGSFKVKVKNASKSTKKTNTVKVNSIKITGKNKVSVNKSIQLKAEIHPANATNKKVKWSSSNKSIATVSKGKVTGKKKGTVTITATSEDNKNVKTTIKITVTKKTSTNNNTNTNTKNVKVKKIVITGPKSVVVKKSIQLKTEISPSNASNKGIEWSSSDKSIATVSKGKVTGKKKGTVTITAKAKDGSKVKGTYKITVKKTSTNNNTNTKNVKVKKIVITGPKSVVIKKSIQLKTEITPNDASNKGIEWSSSDKSIATVSKGKVTGKKKGTVTITAKAKDGSKVKATYKIKVTKVENATSESLVKGATLIVKTTSGKEMPSSIAVGKTVGFAVYRYDTTTKKSEVVSQSDYTIKSSNSKVATATKGKITGKKKGTVTITVQLTDLSLKKSFKIKVADKSTSKSTTDKKKETIKVKKLTIKGSKAVTVDKTIQLKVDVNPNNATNKKVTWTSSNNNVATVDQSGKVKGKKKGTVTITATAKDGSKVKDTIKITVNKKGEMREKQSVLKNIIKVKSIKITGPKTVAVNKTIQLKTDISPALATNKSIGWKSNNEKIATVNKNGKVTGKKKGTVTITATAKDGSKVKATYKITVTQKDEIEMNSLAKGAELQVKSFSGKKLTSTVGVGEYISFKVYRYDTTTRQSTLVNSGQYNISSSNSKAVSTKNPWNDKEHLSAKSTGTSTITIQLKDLSLKTSFKIKVTNKATFSIIKQNRKLNDKKCYTKPLQLNIVDNTKTKIYNVEYETNQTAKKGLESRNLYLSDYVAHITVYNSHKYIKFVPINEKGVIYFFGDNKEYSTNIKDNCDSTNPKDQKNAKVSSITIKGKSTVQKGSSITLEAVISPSYAANKTVKWTSSDEKIATVNSKGVVTGKKLGTVKITATAQDGSKVKKSKKVTVTKYKNMDDGSTATGSHLKVLARSEKKLATTLGVNEYLQFSVFTYTNDKKKMEKITNEKLYTVSSTNEGVVSTSNPWNDKKHLSTKGTGVATITVQLVNSDVKTSFNITVTNNPTFTIKNQNRPLSDGSCYTTPLKFEIVDNSKSNIYNVQYETDATYPKTKGLSAKSLTINGNKAKITAYNYHNYAKYEPINEHGVIYFFGDNREYKINIQDKCPKKKEVKVTGITISGNNSVKIGKTIDLDVVITPSNANNKGVTWSSNNKTIATVNKNGKVTGKKKGTATITATARDGSKVKGTYKIKVLGKNEESLPDTNNISNSTSQREKSNYIHFINVGSSDATLIESNGEYGLIDASNPGNSSTINSSYNDGTNNGMRVLRYLKNIGVDHLKFVIASHDHSDHIGGIPELVINSSLVDSTTTYIYKKNYVDAKGGEVTQGLWQGWNNNDYSNAAIGAMQSKGAQLLETSGRSSGPALNASYGSDGDRYKDYLTFKMGNYTIKIYNLYNNTFNSNGLDTTDENTNSFVTLITNNTGQKALLMGDMNVRDRFEQYYADLIGRVDVYKASHHGYNYSNSKHLFEVLKPKYVVIPNNKNVLNTVNMAEGGKGDFGAARIFINSYNGKVYETGNSSDSLVVKFNNHLTVYNANGSSLAEAREISREVSDGFYIWYDTDSTKQYYYIKSNKFVKDAYVTDNTHNDSGNKNWYWMDKNGVWDGKTYSFVKSNSNWYFKCIKGSDYQAVSTWVTLDKDTYYFDGSGIMATDWKQIKNKWYYFNKEGSMQTGWVSAGGKKYYLSQSDGAMVTGTKTINGKKYEFNSDGSLK